MRFLLLVLGLTLLLAAPVYAFQNQSQSPTPMPLPEDYVVGIEDILSINVWKEADLSVKEVVVRPDGKISIPLIGDLQASGLTPMQLQSRISERMRDFVTAPSVTVVVLKIGSRSVSIVGNVVRPGIYYLGSPMTVLELLARAQGFKEEAKTNKISIVRNEGNRSVSHPFNYKDVSKGKNLKQNIELKNGDVVIVP